MGTPHPAVLAGRPMKGWGGWEGPDRPWGSFGCEGTFNTMPRIIMKGFTAAHLTYGPQNPIASELKGWRKQYARIGQQYLNSESAVNDPQLPRLSPVSSAQGPYTAPESQPGANNGALAMVTQPVSMRYEQWQALKQRDTCRCRCFACATHQGHCLNVDCRDES
jgi:hypothetical protein